MFLNIYQDEIAFRMNILHILKCFVMFLGLISLELASRVRLSFVFHPESKFNESLK